MTGRSGGTRLATVLFLDVVGSTRIAAEMGDERWRSTLARFRRLVRVQLKAFGGREEDTAGDGFFATFPQPASAIRCAASIIRDVQGIGIDVRCGIHIGEVGTVEGRPGGMGVHVGARLMALAGPAEILCTTTVRELILGSNIDFAQRGTQSLRDVPGEWQIFAVSRAPDPLPPKLEPEEARDRWEVAALTGKRRMPIILLGSGVVVLVLAGTIITFESRDHPPPSHPTDVPPALVRIDPATNEIVQKVGRLPDNTTNVVYEAVDGLLWQANWEDSRLIHRNIADGSDPFEIDYVCCLDPAFGFGSAWTYEGRATTTTMKVTRYAEASGTPRTFTVEGSPMRAVYGNAYRAFVIGEDGIWYASGSDTRLHLIDPTSNQDRSFPTGSWSFDLGPTEVLPAGDSVWICGEIDQVVKRFDLSTHKVEDTFPVDAGSCPVAVTGDISRHVWIFNRVLSSLSEVDGETGERLGAYGIGPSLESSSGLWGVGFGSLWFPAGETLFRFDIGTKRTTPIRMPTGVSAGTVVVDEGSGTVWVGNCPAAYCDWLRG